MSGAHTAPITSTTSTTSTDDRIPGTNSPRASSDECPRIEKGAQREEGNNPANRTRSILRFLLRGSSRNAPARESESLNAFLAEMRHAEFDYEPAETPADLARQADTVVTGSAVDAQPGQSYAEKDGEKAVVATSVLWVQVDDVISGAELMTDGFVFVEIAHPAYVGTGKEDGREIPFDQQAFASKVPRADGVFFLTDRTNEPYLPRVIDEGSGRTAGSRITTPFIQGFLVQHEGSLVSVLEPLSAMPAGVADPRLNTGCLVQGLVLNRRISSDLDRRWTVPEFLG